jgi:hypothetical protein
VVVARIAESAEAVTASEKRFNKRKMTPRTKSGLANHGRYENPNSRQIKPKRKLESALLNINVLNPRGGDEQAYRKNESDYSQHR